MIGAELHSCEQLVPLARLSVVEPLAAVVEPLRASAGQLVFAAEPVFGSESQQFSEGKPLAVAASLEHWLEAAVERPEDAKVSHLQFVLQRPQLVVWFAEGWRADQPV